LRRILLAHAAHNAKPGYVQGMHEIAGAALLPENADADPPNEEDEERAFWLLTEAVQKLLPGFFAPGMPGLRVEYRLLERLIGLDDPSLTEQLAGLGIELSMLTASWFLTLFQKDLDEAEARRALDMLYSGRLSPLQLALGIVRAATPALLSAASCEEVSAALSGVLRPSGPEPTPPTPSRTHSAASAATAAPTPLLPERARTEAADSAAESPGAVQLALRCRLPPPPVLTSWREAAAREVAAESRRVQARREVAPLVSGPGKKVCASRESGKDRASAESPRPDARHRPIDGSRLK
jgi:hypothetical protein